MAFAATTPPPVLQIATWSSAGWSCSCPAVSRCSHIGAVQLCVLNENFELVPDGPEVSGLEIRRAVWGSVVPPDEGMALANQLVKEANKLWGQAARLRRFADEIEEAAYVRSKETRG